MKKYQTTLQVKTTVIGEKLNIEVSDLAENTPKDLFCQNNITGALFILARVASKLNNEIINSFPQCEKGFTTQLVMSVEDKGEELGYVIGLQAEGLGTIFAKALALYLEDEEQFEEMFKGK